MTSLPPLCRYCGKPVAKKTERRFLFVAGDGRYSIDAVTVPEPVRTKQEAQRLFNGTIVSVRREDHPRHGSIVAEVGTWDGSSYADPYFCTGEHAHLFGRLMARNGRMTTACAEAMRARGEKP